VLLHEPPQIPIRDVGLYQSPVLNWLRKTASALDHAAAGAGGGARRPDPARPAAEAPLRPLGSATMPGCFFLPE